MLQQSPSQIGSLPPISQYNNIPAKGPLLDRVFSMRYRSYSGENYIEKDGSKKFMDEYDSMPNCTSYLVYTNNKPIASIRSCIFDPEKPYSVPVLDVFKKEIEDKIGLDDKFLEINKFVVEPEYQRSGGVKARFQLFSCMAKETFESDSKNVVMAVRPRHVKFYDMMFNCETISDIKVYPHLKFKTVLLLVKDINKAKDFIFSRAS